ncbi:hypothetical protein [Cyclobacterium jeungdonense]|uniref:Tryptophan-rich sensory protein n=1 Tax=Cyclobacterium jeungdonense TaxID=708087 RepID=A0ABT8CFB3_9BACT|nr:hypothetical protein [Cyclobacterium jeungdonense]MDN3690405.1 hypothetical protein [Cyclobacterium jeungdonense]
MKPLPLLLLNTFSFIVVLFFNYLGGAGDFFGNSVGEISSFYQTLLTPSGYAFSIWGLIYLGWLAYLGFQWYGYLSNDYSTALLPAGIWFFLANLSNALWVWAWTSGYLWISLLIIAFLLFSLMRLVIKQGLELGDVPLRTIFWIWWPITIYSGWVILATVLNASIAIKSLESLASPSGEVVWAVIVLLIATGIYLLLTIYRNMREAALVGTWGFAAIAVNQWEQSAVIGILAGILAVVLLVTAGIHGYINRKTAPLVKIQKGEWK